MIRLVPRADQPLAVVELAVVPLRAGLGEPAEPRGVECRDVICSCRIHHEAACRGDRPA